MYRQSVLANVFMSETATENDFNNAFKELPFEDLYYLVHDGCAIGYEKSYIHYHMDKNKIQTPLEYFIKFM
jgi:hypothetical protein